MVESEADQSLLLNEPLLQEDVYRRVRDTIVSWAHPLSQIERALSFQEPQGCQDLWGRICATQGREPVPFTPRTLRRTHRGTRGRVAPHTPRRTPPTPPAP